MITYDCVAFFIVGAFFVNELNWFFGFNLTIILNNNTNLLTSFYISRNSLETRQTRGFVFVQLGVVLDMTQCVPDW